MLASNRSASLVRTLRPPSQHCEPLALNVRRKDTHASTYRHEKLSLELIAVYGRLYTWEGSDKSLKPMVLMAHQDGAIHKLDQAYCRILLTLTMSTSRPGEPLHSRPVDS